MFRTGCGKPLADRIEIDRKVSMTALRNMGESIKHFYIFSYLLNLHSVRLSSLIVEQNKKASKTQLTFEDGNKQRSR